MYRSILILFIFINGISSFAADGYMFRLQLKNKGESSYTINNPEQFLSKRAIERRKRQGIAIDSSDLPISANYIKAIEELGYKVVAKSKWLSTLSVFCEDSIQIDKIQELDFIDNVTFVWKSDTITPLKPKRDPVMKKIKTLDKSETEYAYSYDQIKTVKGNYLHEQGHTGKGIEIAIIDAGYENLDNILLLDNVIIKGIKDFVYDGEDILQSSDHGLKVLSVMATNRPEVFVGTAPNSKYWLFRSEDKRSEYPIEEDYWIAATEYADSIGVDVINTSLGYYDFNYPAKSYTQDQLDGKTAQISKGAKIATQKGIFVEVSAGNEGQRSWQKIVFPSDVDNVLTVGSMTRDSLVSVFSSRGLTADGRIKPDVVALGSKIHVIASTGEIEESDGTSFAGPVMSGLAACLWEAFPNLTNIELLDIIRKSAHKYDSPDASFGYGIPDMEKAFKLANKLTSGIDEELESKSSDFEVYPIDTIGNFRVKNNGNSNIYHIIASTINGKIVLNEKSNQPIQDYFIPQANNSVFIIHIREVNSSYSKKIKF